jgi:hypothetical protein
MTVVSLSATRVIGSDAWSSNSGDGPFSEQADCSETVTGAD